MGEKRDKETTSGQSAPANSGSSSGGAGASAGTEDAVDHIDESAATQLYAADIGYSVTSHGDGSPTLSPDYVEAREAEAERNANPDRANEELAKKLGL